MKKDNAKYAMLIADVYDTFVHFGDNVTPKVINASLTKKKYNICGYLVTNISPMQTILPKLETNVFFGYLLQDKETKELVVVFRGTNHISEWLNNLAICKIRLENHFISLQFY